MSVTVQNEQGTVSYADSVLNTIAAQAAAECYGLTGLGGRNAVAAGLMNFFSQNNQNSGVVVTTNDDEEITIMLYVTAKYGVSLPAVAENVIEKVKYTVERDTGAKVKSVDIMVQSIQV